MKERPLYILNGNSRNCCSCRACEQKCPKQCISMEEKSGFLYPVIDSEKCIDCGLCGAVCQYNSPQESLDFSQSVYVAYNKDSKTRIGSASGAIFPAVAKYIIEKDGVVFGARYDEDFYVIMDSAESYEDCLAFCKSKYIFSNTNTSYSKVKNYLEAGRMVLFTGSPCQVSGLLHFLGKKYDNLFTMDVICHGFPSETVFQSYKKEMEEKYGGVTVKVDFRHKPNGKNPPWLLFEFDNGQNCKMPLEESPYIDAFFSHCTIMPSCFQCRYTNLNRVSDITIGDFWGAEVEEPEAYNPEGTSAVLVNTEKGEVLFRFIQQSLFTKEIDSEKIVAHNPPLRRQAGYNPFSKRFLNQVKTKSFSYCYTKYIKFGKYLLYPYRLVRKIGKLLFS